MEITVHPQPLQGRLLRRVVNVAFAVSSVAALVFMVPAAFGLERYVISDDSMSGSIGRGSVVFEKDVPVSGLRVGDVITYLPPATSGIDTLVTHRITSIDGSTLRTKGDADATVDPWTFELTETSQARVVQHVPYLGHAILALQDPTLRIALIGVPAGLLALWALRDLSAALRRRTAAGEPDALPVKRPAHDAVTVAAVNAARAARYAAMAQRSPGRHVHAEEPPVEGRAAG